MNDHPEFANQRLLTAVYDSGMDGRITETLKTLGIAGWTKFYDAHGFGGAGLKENTAIFPGTVNMLQIVLPSGDIARVTEALRVLQRSYRRNPGLTLWSQEVALYNREHE